MNQNSYTTDYSIDEWVFCDSVNKSVRDDGNVPIAQMLKNFGDNVPPGNDSVFENMDDDILAEESPLHKGKIPEAESPTPKSIS